MQFRLHRVLFAFNDIFNNFLNCSVSQCSSHSLRCAIISGFIIGSRYKRMLSKHREMTGNKDLRADNTARVTVPFSRQNFVDLSNTRTSLIRVFFYKIQYLDYRVLQRSACSRTTSSGTFLTLLF